MPRESFGNCRRHVRHAAVVFAVQVAEQRIRNRLDILPALAQRRQVDVKDIQPVIEVLAQMSSAYRFFRNFVGSRYYPHIDFEFQFAAQAPDFGIFEDAQ